MSGARRGLEFLRPDPGSLPARNCRAACDELQRWIAHRGFVTVLVGLESVSNGPSTRSASTRSWLLSPDKKGVRVRVRVRVRAEPEGADGFYHSPTLLTNQADAHQEHVVGRPLG